MDVDAVSRHFPHFDARGHAAHYVNSGAYFGRRRLLDLDLYLELVRFSWSHPGVFFGSQGIFNFMLFSRTDEGAVRLDQQELQVQIGDTNREELERRFPFDEGQPRVDGAPVVLHWAGAPKPRVYGGKNDYFEPMTYFRRRFRVALHGGEPRATDGLRLRLEDLLCGDWRGSNLRGRLRRRRRKARGGTFYERIKVAVRVRMPGRLVSTVRRRHS